MKKIEKKSNGDKTKKNNQLRQHPKTQIVTKLNNSNYDKTQKFWLWQHSKTQIKKHLKD